MLNCDEYGSLVSFFDNTLVEEGDYCRFTYGGNSSVFYGLYETTFHATNGSLFAIILTEINKAPIAIDINTFDSFKVITQQEIIDLLNDSEET